MPQGSLSNYVMLAALDTEDTAYPSPFTLLTAASSFLLLLVPWRVQPFCPQCSHKSLLWDIFGLAAEKVSVPLMLEAVRCTTQELGAALS